MTIFLAQCTCTSCEARRYLPHVTWANFNWIILIRMPGERKQKRITGQGYVEIWLVFTFDQIISRCCAHFFFSTHSDLLFERTKHGNWLYNTVKLMQLNSDNENKLMKYKDPERIITITKIQKQNRTKISFRFDDWRFHMLGPHRTDWDSFLFLRHGNVSIGHVVIQVFAVYCCCVCCSISVFNRLIWWYLSNIGIEFVYFNHEIISNVLICVRYIISSCLVTHVVKWTIIFLAQQSFFLLASLLRLPKFFQHYSFRHRHSIGTKVLAYHTRMHSSFKSFVFLSSTIQAFCKKYI